MHPTGQTQEVPNFPPEVCSSRQTSPCVGSPCFSKTGKVAGQGCKTQRQGRLGLFAIVHHGADPDFSSFSTQVRGHTQPRSLARAKAAASLPPPAAFSEFFANGSERLPGRGRQTSPCQASPSWRSRSGNSVGQGRTEGSSSRSFPFSSSRLCCCCCGLGPPGRRCVAF